MSRLVSYLRAVGRPVGSVVIGIALAMVICASVGGIMAAYHGDSWPSASSWRQVIALMQAAALTTVSGAILRWLGRNADVSAVKRREAIFAVALIWLSAGVFGALPFMLGAHMSFVDGVFEAISGFTTTGATVVTHIERDLSPPLLLWRSAIQWLGGMGIVVLFVAIFPNIGVGAKFMFRGEAPGAISEGLQPRIADTSFALWRLYAGFTLAEILLLWASGMDLFESVCHSFTTMSTGGFSTRDASVAAFHSPLIEMIITAFMFIAGANFGLYYTALRGRSLRVFYRSIEFKLYSAIFLGATALLTVSILPIHHDVLTAARYAVFQIGTFMTSTGYVTDDYMKYSPFGLMIIILIMFVGGSSGSTAGGVKVERVVILSKMGWAQLRAAFRPNLVQVIRMDRKPVPAGVLSDVAVFFYVFMSFLGLAVAAVTVLDGVSPGTAFGASLSCLSNMGPAPYYNPVDNFAGYSQPSKVIFSLAMVLGRLELFTILALLIPDFWKR